MKSLFSFLQKILFITLALWMSAASAQQSASAYCQAAALTPLLGASLQIDKVEVVNPGQEPAELPPQSDESSMQKMQFCRIQAVASAGEDSQIHMEVWLPALAAWNGKLVGTGNGGFNPALSYNDMMFALQRGYAVVGGDTGHSGSNGGDVRFGRGHPEKIRDWAERSIHVITVAAKQIVAALAQQAPTRSYYYGCSTGGHQAMAEVQRYPDDYDGLIAGDPANNRIRWNAQSLWTYRANHTQGETPAAIVTSQQQALVRERVLEKCDALDGKQDRVIEDPRQCTLAQMDFAALQCKDGNTAQCLAAAQITALEKIYQGLRDPLTGQQIYPGLQPGSEDGWGFLGNNPARGDFWRYWVDDTEDFDVWKFDFVAQIRKADQMLGAVIDSVNPDLSAFANRGGKLIVYHGWSDSAVSPVDSINYFEKVKNHMGAPAVDDFYRLYMVPGMGHCGGGNGATVFGNAAHQAPQPDRSNDLLMALDHWVETRQAPAHLRSSEIRDGAVVSTRLLCPWPLQGGPGRESCQATKP